MTIEMQLKQEILCQYKSVRAFTTAINIPYSTLDSVFKRGIAKAGIETMLKVFDALNLDIESINTGKLQYRTESAPSELSERACRIARDYDELDQPGKYTIRVVVEAEKKRCVEQIQQADNNITVGGEVVFLRRSVQPASAGTGMYLGPEEFETIRVKKTEMTKRALFCVPVRGNSMEPTYHDGDVLIVESAEDIDIGEIGVFTINGEGFVKKRGDGVLLSLNPAYPPVPMSEDNRCNGRVIGILDPECVVAD